MTHPLSPKIILSCRRKSRLAHLKDFTNLRILVGGSKGTTDPAGDAVGAQPLAGRDSENDAHEILTGSQQFNSDLWQP